MPAELLFLKCDDNAPDNIVSNIGTHENNGIASVNTDSLHNSVDKVTGSGCFDFGGTKHILFNDHDDLSFNVGSPDTPMSIALWLDLTSSGFEVFLDKRGAGDTREYFIYVASSKIYFVLYQNGTGTNIQRRSNSAIPNGKRHLVLTYDGSGTGNGQKIYIDGSLIASSNISSSSITGMTNFNGKLEISGSALSSKLSSWIDDFRMYKAELTTDEILSLWNDGFGIDTPLDGGGGGEGQIITTNSKRW